MSGLNQMSPGVNILSPISSPEVSKKPESSTPEITKEIATPSTSSSCSSSPPPEKKSRRICRVISPDYTIYRDNDLDQVSKLEKIPEELVHRLIRGTIHNMNANAFDTCERSPTTQELLEMSKSIVLQYPSLKDPETSHVYIILV